MKQRLSGAFVLPSILQQCWRPLGLGFPRGGGHGNVPCTRARAFTGVRPLLRANARVSLASCFAHKQYKLSIKDQASARRNLGSFSCTLMICVVRVGGTRWRGGGNCDENEDSEGRGSLSAFPLFSSCLCVSLLLARRGGDCSSRAGP